MNPFQIAHGTVDENPVTGLAMLSRQSRADENRAAGDEQRQGGFLLFEVLMSMVLLGILVAASMAAVLGAMNASAQLERKQAAANLVTRGMQVVRALDARYDDNGCTVLLQGRSVGAVSAQLAAAPSTGMNIAVAPASNPAGCPVGEAAVPLVGLGRAAGVRPLNPVRAANADYTVRTYIGFCELAQGDCRPVSQLSAAKVKAVLQVIVAVSWSDRQCPATGCLVTGTSFVDPSSDPIFDIRAAGPPVAVTDNVCALPDNQALVNLVANDTGALADGPVVVLSPPLHGQLGDLSTGLGTYQPASGYRGKDSFTYRLSGVTGQLSKEATVNIRVADWC